jgi:amidase
MSTQDWNTLIRQKRALRDSRIPLEWRLPESITSRANRDSSVSAFSLLDETAILTEQERAITGDYDATALLDMLATGTLSSLSVTVAFCKRAAIAHQLVITPVANRVHS